MTLDLKKFIRDGASRVHASSMEVEGSVPIQYAQQQGMIKPFFSTSNVSPTLWRTGNIFGNSTMISDKFQDTTKEQEFFVKIKKVSDSIWNFEEKNNLPHKVYVLTGLTDENNFRIDSATICEYNVSIDSMSVAAVTDDVLNISYTSSNVVVQ